jgi:hypothetical protein
MTSKDKDQQRNTSEKPVSLAALDLKQALKGLPKVKPKGKPKKQPRKKRESKSPAIRLDFYFIASHHET